MSIQGVNGNSYTPYGTSAGQNVPGSSGADAFSTMVDGNPETAADKFLAYMKQTPVERMQEDWLRAHGLTRDDLDKMSPEERKGIMEQMAKEIEEIIKRNAESNQKVDVLV